jgi:NitT/TauT family transport system substrate-binding protein
VGRVRTNIIFAAVTIVALLSSVVVLWTYIASTPSDSVLRLGYFPNVTHAQALYGITTGFFQGALRPEVTLEPQAFNAGSTAVASLLANQVDVIFVGPSPTLNALSASGPDYIRVIAGGSSGGASFVIQSDLTLDTNASFAGKKFASPQYGNTQDLALKHFLFTRGHRTLDRGGDVDVINAANSDILSLFQLRQIDGAWVPEPWASRLVLEAHGKVFVDERSLWPNGRFVTTHLLTTKRYLDAHRLLLSRLLDAEVTMTLRLQKLTLGTMATINNAIVNATRIRLANATLQAAFGNLNLTYDPIRTSLTTYLAWAKELGLLPAGVDASRLYDLSLLNDVLIKRGLAPVS